MSDTTNSEEASEHPGSVAKPGPHPHESTDSHTWTERGKLSLPEGVEPYDAPTEGDSDADAEGH